jgi:hypothetical protein|tara:strand:- start:866 stop:1093 length:228 start_codon:yes stop_codon:yes gene_type:complete
MKTMMMLTIAVLMTMTMAKSDETIDTKVKNYIVKEWTDTKEYQKASWQKGKEQNAKNWIKIKNLFTKVKNNVTQN